MDYHFTKVAKGFLVKKSRIYHGRNECYFYGYSGEKIKTWIREKFGDDDDLVYTNSVIDSSVSVECGALITDEQLLITALVWK